MSGRGLGFRVQGLEFRAYRSRAFRGYVGVM